MEEKNACTKKANGGYMTGSVILFLHFSGEHEFHPYKIQSMYVKKVVSCWPRR